MCENNAFSDKSQMSKFSFSFNDLVIGRYDTKMCTVLLYIHMRIYIHIYKHTQK